MRRHWYEWIKIVPSCGMAHPLRVPFVLEHSLPLCLRLGPGIAGPRMFTGEPIGFLFASVPLTGLVGAVSCNESNRVETVTTAGPISSGGTDKLRKERSFYMRAEERETTLRLVKSQGIELWVMCVRAIQAWSVPVRGIQHPFSYVSGISPEASKALLFGIPPRERKRNTHARRPTFID